MVLVNLCKQYQWDAINIVHANDVYGLYLSLSIQELAVQSDIVTKRISISYEEGEEELSNTSFIDAAKAIKESDTYISILIIHSTPISAWFFDALENHHVLKYIAV